MAQEYDPSHPYCRNCGAPLSAELKPAGHSYVRYRVAGFIIFSISFLIFLFVSRYYGGAGMLLGLMLYLLGWEKKRLRRAQ